MLYEFNLDTSKINFYNITPQVRKAIVNSGVSEGIAVISCPHTTAGITINENADPDVVTGLIYALEKTFPDRAEFRHMEGNSAAHLKASAMGAGQTVIVKDSRPLLGTWQGIFFCEFDPPRRRKFYVKVM